MTPIVMPRARLRKRRKVIRLSARLIVAASGPQRENAQMHIERNEILCFQAVIEAGGFSRAADRLDLSQSAVSQTIANLEHRIGAVLLKRGHPPQLTEAGIRLLRYAETVLNQEREALADIAQIRSGALSTLSLALSPATNARFGVTLLKEFSERNPLTRFRVVVAPSREIVYGLSDGRWELGFGPFHHSTPEYLVFHPCFPEVQRLMIAADHPSRAALQRDPEAELRTLPLITSYLDNAPRRTGRHRLRSSFGSVWEVSHLDLRLALCAEGKGVTYVSDLVTHLPRELVPIGGLPFSSIERQVGVYYLKHQPLSRAGGRFLALCREKWDASPTE
jgi:LysR family transcriptional regulator, hydrogen peroxide-inducible genes activator